MQTVGGVEMMTWDNRPPQCQIHITQVRIMMKDDGDDDDR